MSAKDHADIAAELQTLLLQEYKRKLEAGEATATDLGNLARLLIHNGWNFNEKLLPTELQDKLTERVAFDEEPDGETLMRLVG